ncbi:hypothetical protein GCK72_025364 [Caenorhabditis remanei]|uniref:Uncharacterized protein n=1 Tax=Caenorhabditis remanei TaxID=31234 RepID=A0A6A5G1R3_CAERE|nr:hypothetical protein GCK72_025364 [Caenorhabditis remanei]KAF1748897.1 hypothetical protein GCK72_025364 [Caenorhabditis remanei]
MDNPEGGTTDANEHVVVADSEILKKVVANSLNENAAKVVDEPEENGNPLSPPMQLSEGDSGGDVNGKMIESGKSMIAETEASGEKIDNNGSSSPVGSPVEEMPMENGVVKDETSETGEVGAENLENAPIEQDEVDENVNDEDNGDMVEQREEAEAVEGSSPIHYYVPMSPIIEGAAGADLFYDGPEVNYHEEEIDDDDDNLQYNPENVSEPFIEEEPSEYPIEGAAMPDQQMEEAENGNVIPRKKKRPHKIGGIPFRVGPHTPTASPPLSASPPPSPQYDELDADYRFALKLQEEEDRLAQHARRSNWSNQRSSSDTSSQTIQALDEKFLMMDDGGENRARNTKGYDECYRLFNQCIDERSEEFVPTPYSIEGFEDSDYISGYREVLNGHPFPLHKPIPPVPPGSPKGPETSPLSARTDSYRVVSNPIQIPLEELSGTRSGNLSNRREPLARVPNVTRLFGELPTEHNNNSSGSRSSGTQAPLQMGPLVNEAWKKRRRLNENDNDLEHGPTSRRRLDFSQAQSCRDEELDFQRAVEESKREYELSRNNQRSRNSGEGSSNMYGEGPSSSNGAGSSRDYGEGPSTRFGEGSSRDYGEGPSNRYGEGSSRDYGEGPSTSYGAGSSRDYGEGPSTSSGPSNSYGGGSSRDYGEGPSTSYGAGSSSSYYRSGPSDSYGAGPSNRYDEGPSTSDSYGAGPSSSNNNFRFPLQPLRIRKANPHRRNGLTESTLPSTSSGHYNPLSPLSPLHIPQDSHLYRPNSNQEEDDVFTLDTIADVDEPEISSTTLSVSDPRHPIIKWDDPEKMPPLETIPEEELNKMPEDYIEAIKIEQSIEREPEEQEEPKENQENDEEAERIRIMINDYLLIIRSYICPSSVVPNVVFNTRFEVYIRFPFLQRPLYVQNVLAALLIPDNRGDILPRMPQHIRDMTVDQFFKYAANMAMGLRLQDKRFSRVIPDADLQEAADEYLRSMEIIMLELFPEQMVYDGMLGRDISRIDLRMYEMYRDQVIEEKKDHVMKKLMQSQSRLVVDSHSVTDCRTINRTNQQRRLQSPELPELGAASMASPQPYDVDEERFVQGVVNDLLSNPQLATVEQQAAEDESNHRVILELMESILLNIDQSQEATEEYD